jgi:TP901 family phage tail tape measure protein
MHMAGKRVAELEVVVTANTSQAKSELASVSRSFHNIIAGGALMGAGSGLLGWFKNAVTSGAQFEQTMIRVQQLATGAEVSVDALTKKAFAVDQTTIYSAQEIAQAMEQLGREGFTGEQILGGWTDAAVNFAAVIDEDLTLATNIFGQVARVFKDEGLSAARTADILSQAILRSGRPAAEFATGMQYIGSIAAQLGVPLEETAISLSYLQSLGIKGRSAGTGLRSMFTELAAGADEFGMSHGVQAFDPETGAFVGMPAIISQFDTLLDSMSKAEGLSFLTDIFGKPAASPLYALFTGGIEAYEEHQRKMEDLGTAATFMRTLMDTIGGSLDRFQASASNAMRQIGVIGGNMIRPLIDVLTILLSAFANAPRIFHIAAAAAVVLTGALAGLAGAIMLFKGLGGLSLLMSMLTIMAGTALAVAVGIGAIAAAFFFFSDEISGAIDGVKEFLDPVMELFDYLSRINQADNPLDFLMAQGWDGAMLDFARGLGAVVEGLADLWYFISRGDWDRFMTRLPGELQQMWEGVQVAFSVVPEVLGFTDWTDMVLTALAWTGENLILDPIVAVISGTIEFMGDLLSAAGNLWGWVKGKLYGTGNVGTTDAQGNKNVSALGMDTISVGTVIVDGLLELGGGLLAAAGNLWGWVEAKLGGTGTGATGLFNEGGDQIYASTGEHNINLGKIMIDAAVEMAEDIWDGAADFAGWVTAKIQEAGDIFIPVEGVKIQMIDPVLDAAQAEGGGDEGGGFIDSIGTQLSNMIETAVGLPEKLGKAYGSLMSKGLGLLNFDEIADVDASNFGQNVGAWIHDLLVTASKIVTGGPTLIISGIASFITGAVSELSIDDLTSAAAGVANLPNVIGSVMSGFLAGLITGQDSSEWSFGEFKEGLAGRIREAISGAFQSIVGGPESDVATGLFDDMGDQIMAPSGFSQGIIDTITGEMSKAFEGITSETGIMLGGLWPEALKLPTPTFDFTGITTAVDTVVTFIEDQIDRIVAAWDKLTFWNKRTENPGMYETFQNNLPSLPEPVINNERDLDAIGQYPNADLPPAQVPEGYTVDVTVNRRELDTLESDIQAFASEDHKASVVLDGIDGVMTGFAAAFDMGRAWAGQTYTGKAALNVDSVMISAAAAFDIGRAWAGSTYTGTFGLNVDGVMVAAGAAFEIGRAWAGQVFTASFSVDTSGITAAVGVARQAAADIAAIMPHSPAKEGPLKEPITFDYIAENFAAVADDMRYRAGRLTSDVAGMARNRNLGAVDVAAPRSGGGVKNYFFAVTGDDLARLERQSREGTLDIEYTARELEMGLGMN